ncbi:GNAT family N-acetyltransferase [Candidatus Palauibacter sp.]|uniref:GNAT family N-acetyltransferase n=1 Tax=Candidatus Palauibacter sp. TaxID=3101350 RepID=UPI003B5C565D
MTIVRQLAEGDRTRVAHLQQQAFMLPPERIAIAGNYPLEQGWVVEDGGTVQGSLRVQKLGQFFGGRAVPCAAISSVKVAAEARGRGYGGALLGEVLEALRSEGVAASSLFPVHGGVYRRYGWEFAFAHQRRALAISELAWRRAPDTAEVSVEPFEEDDLEAVSAFYRSRAAGENGPFDRDEAWWEERVLAPRSGRTPYRYLARSGGEVCGYMVYTHEPSSGTLPYGFDLDCRDFYWDGPAALAALLNFVRGHAGMGQRLLWPGPPSDPIELVLTGLAPPVARRMAGMFRLVDVPAALAARGYPEDVGADLYLWIEDDVLPANAGPIAVRIVDGRARVSGPARDGSPAGPADRAGRSAARVDVRVLAGLFTGQLTADTAARAGLLPGVDADTRRTLRDAFAGPVPWMAEFY